MRDLVFRFAFPVRIWVTPGTGEAQGASFTREAVAYREQIVDDLTIVCNDALSETRLLFHAAPLARAQPSFLYHKPEA